MERHFEEAEAAMERAAEYEAKGWPGMAQVARRKAAGHRSAYTRIARYELGA